MRKISSVVFLSLLALGAFAGQSQAAFVRVSSVSFTAAILFSGAGTVTASAVLKNIAGGTIATSLAWTGVSLGTTKWKAADQYIELTSNITAGNGAVQIYTNNLTPTASPRASTSTLNPNPVGLVGYSTTTLLAEGAPLPMCWRVAYTSTDTLDITWMRDVNPGAAPDVIDRLYSARCGNAYPCFLWMMDRGTPASGGFPAFSDGLAYAEVKNGTLGIQHAEATYSGAMASSVNPIYIGAAFHGAQTPRGYKTSTLTIETFTE